MSCGIIKQEMTDQTQKTLNKLLSGKHPDYEKFKGKHVMIVQKEIALLPRSKKAREKLEELEEKYGERPVISFVPRDDTSYILWVLK